MRYSQLFAKSQKTVPAAARFANHRLLVKGGFVRQISTGRWAILPLGMRVWEKIYRLIDREMQALGAQKVVTPTLHPIEIWQASNRDQAFGEEMMVVDDHYQRRFALGATAEGIMLEVVKATQPSYRDLPIILYQFSQKFRDDKRPRGGLLRLREFMMKDAYSFAANERQSLAIYKKFYRAYQRLARQLEIKVEPVLADSGAIGGSLSHEFMVEHPQGDQHYLVCDHCGYAANLEKAEFKREPINLDEPMLPQETITQPEWVCTMEDNEKYYRQPRWRYLKNVVYRDEKGRLIIASIRGDQQINETKLRRALGVEKLAPASREDLAKIGTRSGWVHSWGHRGVIYIGDYGLKMVHNFIGGQKTKNSDSKNVNYGRDFKYQRLADIVDAPEGARCPRCQKGHLHRKTGLEWGHIFKIDHFYSRAQNGTFINRRGQPELIWMGSYGIGLERSLAIVVEKHHDEKGIIWPLAIAPFWVHLVALDLQDKTVAQRAEKIYQRLKELGVEVLFDDRRQVSAGEKFADADLIGIPWRWLVSRRQGEKIEVKNRRWKKSRQLNFQAALRLLSQQLEKKKLAQIKAR